MRKDIITDHAKLSWILDQCQILHLGLTNQRGTYVVPVHYGYQEGPDGHYTIFIFTAPGMVRRRLPSTTRL